MFVCLISNECFYFVVCLEKNEATERRFISGQTYKNYRKFLDLENYSDLDVTCTNCYSKYYRKKQSTTLKKCLVIDENHHDDPDLYILKLSYLP